MKLNQIYIKLQGDLIIEIGWLNLSQTLELI